MNEAKKPKAAKTPKLKTFGTGKFSTGEGWVHLAARGGKSSPVVKRWRLEK